jgi:hypothetical protein
MVWRGDFVVSKKCKSFVSATLSSLDPTLLSKSAYVVDDTATVIISNCSRNKLPQENNGVIVSGNTKNNVWQPNAAILQHPYYCCKPGNCRHRSNVNIHHGGCQRGQQMCHNLTPHNEFARWQKNPIHTCVLSISWASQWSWLATLPCC